MSYTPAEVLPHAAPMILLDRIIAYDADQLEAELTVPAEGLFNDAEMGGAVPAWVGIEYLAQAVAAHDGCHCRDAGISPKIGFLLGSRNYESNVTAFLPGVHLRVRVAEVLRGENGMAVFEGLITGEQDGQAIRVTARINGFQPDDPSVFLKEQA
ncbi:ApeP family dehydratase [Chitinilyticum piscinae]|uniref:3-hydroxylacyl-ACP dehydratase n=1 Tax=Chitinilyticum piscinae TaxID=2866724 RepID=A0A8J7FJ17_9NEIS|nr:3-hydroxylacyl-ACP dehydratase [Chitinilyticum piscinae]MBE9607814.1 3-hydroxylacyl-ACP dehydratase [Chitinilyticum piscinae]